MTPPILRVEALEKSFGGLRVLRGVDLSVGAGEVTVVGATNGTGKSTLLECVGGAQRMDRGSVWIDGQLVTPQSKAHWRDVFSILDDFAWFPELTVLDHYRLLAPSLTRDQGLHALAALDVEALIDRRPATLSSGQRQRCAVVSAAIRPWRVLLIDEPERHLDAESLRGLGAWLASLRTNRAIVIATHAAQGLAIEDATELTLRDGRLDAPT